ncbi:MAG: oatA 2 [Pseudonocardiales bacterium]|nr:oatA 2 [Pseudonocardiales bacterium]
MTLLAEAVENHQRRVRRRLRENPVGNFRPDIEGLRAFAVGLVVLDHLAGWPKGGFIGVDVFFVISGFLITGLLLKETERRGRISFLSFYNRRARRILPASITVLAAVWVAAHVAFAGERVTQTVSDIWWSLGFLANVHFAHIGTDYFQANRPPSPVQHFWSLAVEEQFYLVWPIVMLLVLSVVGRGLNKRHARGLLLGVVTAGTVASFAWAVSQTKSNPSAAYFSTPVRAWELGLGAIIAIVAVQWPNVASRLGNARGPLSAAGLVGVVVSAFVVSSTSGFPAPWAALPVVATGLVIFAGIGQPLSGGVVSPLTNPVSRYIGRISYSLYLWHWPVIVIVDAYIPKSAAVYYPAIITAMFALTIISYHFIETPLRKVQFRRPAPSWRPTFSDEHKYAALGGTALVAFTLCLWVLQPPPKVPSFIDVGAPASAAGGQTTTTVVDESVAVPSEQLSSAISSALQATKWPTLTPSRDAPVTGMAPEMLPASKCLNPSSFTNQTLCTFGPATATKRAFVVGDSIAVSWLPAVRSVLGPQGYLIRGVGLSNCPFSAVKVTIAANPAQATACNNNRESVAALIKSFNPTLLIISDSTQGMTFMTDHAQGSTGQTEWANGLAAQINASVIVGTKVVILSPPPAGASVATCATATSSPSGCVSQVSDDWTAKKGADKAGAKLAGATYVDDSRWFCSGGNCPIFVSTVLMRWDEQHLTSAYAQLIAPELAKVI